MYYIYRIYYNNRIVYVGRTNNIDNRVRQHILSGKLIDVQRVTRIEIARLETEADMNLYELYYILLIKPELNTKDTTQDELTLTLPELEFHEYVSYKFSEWKQKALEKKANQAENKRRVEEIKTLLSNEITDMGKEILLTQYQIMKKEN